MISLILPFLIHSIASSQTGTLYTIKDLQVLEQEKNFEEFLAHVNDVRPSERQKLWKDMYQRMGMEMIDYKIRTKDFSMDAYKKVETLGRSSAMVNDEFFQLKRAIYARSFFTACYSQASERSGALKTKGIQTCDTELGSFWYFSNKDADIGLHFAKLIEIYSSSMDTWPFYRTAITDKVAPIYCAKPDIQRAVIKKLTNESFDSEFNDNYKSLIHRLVPDDCFAKIIPTLRTAFQSSTSTGVEKEMALNLLSAVNKLSLEEEDLYAILYMLDGPVVGDKMNLAWKKIENLSTEYTKRMKLLAQIKSLPTIPDKIFKDPGLPRHKAIINLFAKNFPEYLNYYGESCISYLDHKSDSVGNINSSFQCNEFLKTARDLKATEKVEWISDSVERQYSGLKK
ncbi:MAG: hypothetical protein K2Q18_16075 [Bdellovibrionales bacterium]|nr:hypothetical protein [Bdellovibrionales bacterium]